jgi:hypothetical protein
MKVTLLGHASVLVEMNGATCLMDPVFFDPFEEGAVVSCPEQVVGKSAGLTCGQKLSGPVDTVYRIAASALAGGSSGERASFTCAPTHNFRMQVFI